MLQLNTRVRTRSAAMAAALVLVPGVVAGAVVTPAAPVWGAVVMTAFDESFDQNEEDLLYVRYLALYDPRALVRTAAWNALTSKNVPAAVDRFLNSGMKFAVDRAKMLASRNEDFARRVLATHTVEYSPEVHAAARDALNRGTAALDAFARTGYAAAKERDRLAREADGEQAAALSQADRDFVVHLRDTDPGAQVRAAAGLAVRPEATDADVVEFYAYDWAAAAAVDLEVERTQRANSDMVWRSGLEGLIADAKAAQQAALEAEGEAKELARATALRAWGLVGDRARPATSAWDGAVLVAQQQAANWQQVAVAAGEASSNPNWAAIADAAGDNEQHWQTTRDTAAKQAAYWAQIHAMVLAGEHVLQS